MKYFLNIFLIFSISHLGLGFDMATYKTEYQAQVAVPYKTAVTVAASNIIEYLAITPVPETEDAEKFILASLNVQARALSSNLGSASSASDDMRQKLDIEDQNLLLQASAVENQTIENNKQIDAVNSQIQQQTDAVNAAQAKVNEEQENVRRAQATLDDQRRREDEASHHCTFIGGWFGHKICQVFNHQGIVNAENARNDAQGNLDRSQNQLYSAQSALGSSQAKMTNLQQVKSGLEAKQNDLNSQLSSLNLARLNVVGIDGRLKTLIGHLNTLFGDSKTLVAVITNLIDMETVIDPITSIADDIMAFTPNAADVTYLAAMKQKIAANLPLVQMKLPEYGLIPSK